MQRIKHPPRPNWIEKVESVGFSFHSRPTPYWDESTYYQFTAREIELFEQVMADLHAMCKEAIAYIIDNDLFQQMGIPGMYVEWIIASWRRGDRSLYGRFDFSYDGRNPPKLLEYNADTPTSLVESSVAQWYWLQDVFPQRDQFNLIHEQLLERWTEIGERQIAPNSTVYFTCPGDFEEDYITTEYMRDLAMQAGLHTRFLSIEEIGWDHAAQAFVDLNNQRMANLFKLYPWEWLLNEEFGRHLPRSSIDCFLEPPWKAMLSNKAILPILWELNPNHPNLLPAYFEPKHFREAFVRKPLFGREGQGITIIDRRARYPTEPDAAAEPCIYQEFSPLVCLDDRYPMIGGWMVGDEPVGMGIRESPTLITNDESRFVPHCFV